MNSQEQKRFNQERRRLRVRKKVTGSPERPRLAVRRSIAHIFAQVIDDSTGRVLAAASSQGTVLRNVLKSGGNVAAAKAVGKHIAEMAKSKGITQVCFDRGGRKYHGRVKALADAAREAGLKF